MPKHIDLKENLNKWLALDDQAEKLKLEIEKKIKKEKEEIQKLDAKKAKLEQDLVVYFKRNKMEDKTINFNDNQFEIKVEKKTKGLSLKYLENILTNYAQDEKEANKMMKYIKDNREITVTEKFTRKKNKPKSNSKNKEN